MSATSLVLHVEDDPNDVLLVRRAFQKADVAAPLKSVADGLEAEDYLAGRGAYSDRAKHPLPSLILLDIKLPKKSGLEVLEWLRGQPDLRWIPVIMLTSSQNSGDVRRAYELGANAYLVKPTEISNLIGMIRALAAFWMTYNTEPASPAIPS